MSTISRRLGSGGKMYVPRDRYSFTMSFCVVPRSSAERHALRFGVGDVEAEQPRRGGVDRHRRVHRPGRDAVEQRAHVAEVGDRHADLAHLAARRWGVGVVAGLGGQVEGDRQAGLALGQVGAVERVRRGRCRVPGVGPHEPRLVDHVRHCGGWTAEMPLGRASRERRRGGQSLGQHVEVPLPRDVDGAERGEVGGDPLDVEQRRTRCLAAARRGRPAPPSTRRVRRWNIDSPANKPPTATPYRPPASSPSGVQASTLWVQPRSWRRR